MADTQTATAAKSRALPRWFLFARAGIEIVAGGYCIISQFNTTRDSIFGIMQSGTQIPEKLSTQQVLDLLAGNATKLNSIAFTIALVIQVVFWWFAFQDVKHPSKISTFVAGLLLFVEIASDVQFASGSDVVVNGDLTRILMTGGSAWMGIALYAICLSYGSSFVFINGIKVLGEALSSKSA